jgi:GABA permease
MRRDRRPRGTLSARDKESPVMAIYQCPRCELRFRTESEYNYHLKSEHQVDPSRLDPYRYGREREQKPLYPDLVDVTDDAAARVLIVGNASLRSERLQQHLADRAQRGNTSFKLVVPAVATSDAVQHKVSFASVGGPAHPREETLSGGMLARHRMDEALTRLRAAGLQIDGVVGDSDPMRAAAEALAGFNADEIILSTLPRDSSRWLASDLPTEMRRRFGIPVTVVPAA